MKALFKPKQIKIKYSSGGPKDKSFVETAVINEGGIKFTRTYDNRLDKSDIAWSMKLDKESYKRNFNELFNYLEQFFDRQKMLVDEQNVFSLELDDEIGVKRKVRFTTFTSPELMAGLVKFFANEVTDKLPVPAFIKD